MKMMVKNLLTPIIILFTSFTFLAQSKITETVILYPNETKAVKKVSYTIPTGHTYSGDNPEWAISNDGIGMSSESVNLTLQRKDKPDTNLSVTKTTISRSVYTFYLNLIKYTTTNHVNITNIKLYYNTNSSGYTFKITQPSSNSGIISEIWPTVESSSSKQTGIAYSGSNVNPASGLNSAISSCLQAGTMYLGVMSENESTNGSNAMLGNFYLVVTYERDNEARTITAQNDMSGYVGG